MKFKLTQQIFMLFSFVIVLSLLIFTLITDARLDSTYASLNISALEEFVNYTEGLWERGNPLTGTRFQYYCGKIDDSHYIHSEDFFKLIDEKTTKVFLTEEIMKSGPNHNRSGIFKGIKGPIYVSGKINDNGVFFIAVCDAKDTVGFKNNTFTRFILIFGIILLWGNAIVAIWSQQIVSRLKKIQKSVTLLPQTDYQTEITPDGEDEISDLANSIETMRQEIVQNEATKREMLQNVSHDIKTPIAVIKSYAEAIIDGIETTEGANVIVKQAEILKKKAEQLLEYNKLEYLKSKKDFQEVNMYDLITNVMDNYRFQTHVEFELNLENVYFKGFIENYHTVLTNLLDNAIRYAEKRISITLKDNYLEVYNDGPTIEESFFANMYKPYEKGNKGQFGLGMSIVKRTLDYFDMKIEAKNHDIGVSFIITHK